MSVFHVRYWFDSNGPSKTGEQVIEAVEAESAEEAAQRVQDRMGKEPIFRVIPAFGPASEREKGSGGGGLVLIQTAHVRYVEVIPAPAAIMASGGR